VKNDTRPFDNMEGNMNKGMERRRHARYRPRHIAFALIKKPTRRPVEIVDISRGGLAVTYMDEGARPAETSRMDIFSADGKHLIQDIPYRTVWDVETTPAFSFSRIQTRQRGMAFEGPAQDGDATIDRFLETNVRHS